MLKRILVPLVLPLLLLLSNGSDNSLAHLKQVNNDSEKTEIRFTEINKESGNPVARSKQDGPENQTGTLEKMIVAEGAATMDIDLNRLNGIDAPSEMKSLSFAVAPNSFFTILVFNKLLRGPESGSMALIPKSFAVLPAALNESFNQLVIEKATATEPYDIVVRDGKTGFTFFNVEGNLYDYDAKSQSLGVKEGRLLVSKEFATKLQRPSEAGAVVGRISITATMRTIEITQLVNGEARSDVLP